MKILSVADVEYVAYELVKKLLTFDEPIPDFVTRFPNTLESCLVAPFQKFDGKDLFFGAEEKIPAIFPASSCVVVSSMLMQTVLSAR